MEGRRLQLALCILVICVLTPSQPCGPYPDPGTQINQVVFCSINCTFVCSRDVKTPSIINMVILKEKQCTELYGPAEFKNGTLVGKFQISATSELVGNETACCQFAQLDDQDLSLRYQELYNCSALLLPRISTKTTESTAHESSALYIVVILLVLATLFVMFALLLCYYCHKQYSEKSDGSDDYRKSGKVMSETMHTPEDCVTDDDTFSKSANLIVGDGDSCSQNLVGLEDVEEPVEESCSQNLVGLEDVEEPVAAGGEGSKDKDEEFLSCNFGLNGVGKQAVTKAIEDGAASTTTFLAKKRPWLRPRPWKQLLTFKNRTMTMSLGLYGYRIRYIVTEPQVMTMSLGGLYRSSSRYTVQEPQPLAKNFEFVFKTTFQNLVTEPKPITISLVGLYGGDYPNLVTRLQGSPYRSHFLNMFPKPKVIDMCLDEIYDSSYLNLVTSPLANLALTKNFRSARCVFITNFQNLDTEPKRSQYRNTLLNVLPKPKALVIFWGDVCGSSYLNLVTRPQALANNFEFVFKTTFQNLVTEPKPITRSLVGLYGCNYPNLVTRLQGSPYRSHFLNMFSKPRLIDMCLDEMYESSYLKLVTSPPAMTTSFSSLYRINNLKLVTEPQDWIMGRDRFKKHFEWKTRFWELQPGLIESIESTSHTRTIKRDFFEWHFASIDSYSTGCCLNCMRRSDSMKNTNDYSTYTDLMLGEALVKMDYCAEQQIIAVFAAIVVAHAKLQENLSLFETII